MTNAPTQAIEAMGIRRPADQRFTVPDELQAFKTASRGGPAVEGPQHPQAGNRDCFGNRLPTIIGSADRWTRADIRLRRPIGRSGSSARSPSTALPRRPTSATARLPTPIIADCLNFNLRFTRGVEDVKLLAQVRMTMSASCAPPPAPTTAASGTRTWSTPSSSVSAMGSRDIGGCRVIFGTAHYRRQ